MKENKKTSLANLDAGKSLRLFMAEQRLQALELAAELGVSNTTMSKLRHNKLISGSNLVMLSDYFGVSASDFIRKGES